MKKTGQYGITYYIGKHFEIVNGVKTKHIFAGGMRIAQISNGVRYYHHKDHLGSTIGVTNDAGTLVWKADYEPYGLVRGGAQTGMDTLIRHRFTDQEYDAETRLYNYNARLYDPTIARFISPDTIVDNPYSSLALNRYMYVAGNPLRYTDPSGHLKIGKFFKRAFHVNKETTQFLMAAAIVVAGVYALPYIASAGWGSVSASAVGWGAATGGAIGGYSAYVQGGNVLQGVLFGAVMGAASGALCSALPVIGTSTSGSLGFWGSVGQGAALGAIQGASFGAAVGYGGGVGNMNAILKGAAYGAAMGAATGAVLGGAKYYTNSKLYAGIDKPTTKSLAEGLKDVAEGGDAASAVTHIFPDLPPKNSLPRMT